MAKLIGIDIGGSGIKGAVVDTKTGEFLSERIRIETPSKSTPENCAKVIARIIDGLAEQGAKPDSPIGITVPAPVVHGMIPMIANLDKSWFELKAQKFFEKQLNRPVVLANDADAAGLAEVYCGAAKGQEGIVIVTTLGTGIGSAIINNGVLLPNTELGHLELNGYDAETQASAGIRDKYKWSYEEWAPRLDAYYQYVERLFWPDLFVVGGGVSKNHQQFLPLLHLRTPIIPAKLRNRAGIVGAALVAEGR
jgi:polyphosphate glucokinase